MLPSSTILDSTGLDKDVHFHGESQECSDEKEEISMYGQAVIAQGRKRTEET